MELSIKELAALLWKQLKWILLVTILFAVIFYGVSRFVLDPYYTASVQLYVDSEISRSNEDLNDLNYAQKVVETYINFLKTNVFYTQVMEDTHLPYSSQQLHGMTSIETVNATEVFEISVTSKSATDSYLIIQSMQKLAPQLISDLKSGAQIRVVDPVTFPASPSSPHILINTMFGGVLGCIFMLVFFILWGMFDVKIKNKEELLNKYQQPVLGTIPDFISVSSTKQQIIRKIPLLKKRQEKVRRAEALNQDTDFLVVESYKSLRTNLRYLLREKGCKKILINSPSPRDGKSTTCSNIGITLAQTGAKVLLIDCDLRKGRLHRIFYIRNKVGLSDVLAGLYAVEEVIQYSRYENLEVLTNGRVPPNPAEILASNEMENLMWNLERKYDYIILDSPPVHPVSDALSLAKFVDGVLMVVREKCTTHPSLDSAIKKFELVDARMLGIVLNGVTVNKNKHSTEGYYYYKHNK